MSAVVKRAKQDAEALAVDDGDGDGDGDDDDIDLCALSLFLLSFFSLFGCFHPSCSLPFSYCRVQTFSVVHSRSLLSLLCPTPTTKKPSPLLRLPLEECIT